MQCEGKNIVAKIIKPIQRNQLKESDSIKLNHKTETDYIKPETRTNWVRSRDGSNQVK